MITPGQFLSMINQESKSNFKLGKIDPDYVSGQAKVVFDGELTPSGKEYTRLSSYTPIAGDRVLIVSIAGTYVILGKIV